MLWVDSGRGAKQSGSLFYAVPSQSATANWPLWEPHTATHSHTVDDIGASTHQQWTSQPSAGGLTPTGAPLLLLSRLSAQTMFEVPPAVLFDQRRCVVSCHCNFVTCTDSSLYKQPLLSSPSPPHTQVLHSIFHKVYILIQSPFTSFEILH